MISEKHFQYVLAIAIILGVAFIAVGFNSDSITGYTIFEDQWEHSLQVTASTTDSIITQEIIFDQYKPSSCEDGILVTTSSGDVVDYSIINETYENDTCIKATIQFSNIIYENNITNQTNTTINDTLTNETNTTLNESLINETLLNDTNSTDSNVSINDSNITIPSMNITLPEDTNDTNTTINDSQINDTINESLINETNTTINDSNVTEPINDSVNETINDTNTTIPDTNTTINESVVNESESLNETEINDSVSEPEINDSETINETESESQNNDTVEEVNETDSEDEPVNTSEGTESVEAIPSEENNSVNETEDQITGAAILPFDYIIYYGKIVENEELIINYSQLKQGEIVLNQSVNWTQEIFIYNPNNFTAVSQEINLDLPSDATNIKVFNGSNLFINNSMFSVNLEPQESLDLVLEFQTSPVQLEIQEINLTLAELLPPEAKEIKVYANDTLVGNYRNLQQATLTIPGTEKKIFVYHNSSLTYSDISISLPYEEGIILSKIVNGTQINATEETTIKRGELIWQISEL